MNAGASSAGAGMTSAVHVESAAHDCFFEAPLTASMRHGVGGGRGSCGGCDARSMSAWAKSCCSSKAAGAMIATRLFSASTHLMGEAGGVGVGGRVPAGELGGEQGGEQGGEGGGSGCSRRSAVKRAASTW